MTINIDTKAMAINKSTKAINQIFTKITCEYAKWNVV